MPCWRFRWTRCSRTSARTSQQFGVEFDRWYSERALGESGAIERALERLKKQGRLFQQEGATWFRATEFGDEKDRVVVRENGQKTYFASDIAYHLEKRERGFEQLIDVLGADHHGYVAQRARRPRGHGRARRQPGSQPRAVREPVPRRRKDPDGQARGAVRHPAPAARGSRQRCVPLLLPDAQPRAAARLRPRARQVAHQRESGLLHPVRACAGGERHETAGVTRARVRSRARPCLARPPVGARMCRR